MRGGTRGTRAEPVQALLGRVDFSSLGENPFDEIALFATITSSSELDQLLRQEVAVEVAAILQAVENADAFDVVELLRMHELMFTRMRVAAGEPEGSAAAVELIALILLGRGHRKPAPSGVEARQPHTVVPELVNRARRLLRLAMYKQLTDARLASNAALAKLASDYQLQGILVRGMQYESVERRLDSALFDRPDIDGLLLSVLGFCYSDFIAVREAIRALYDDVFFDLRDTTGDLAESAIQNNHELSPQEQNEFRAAIVPMMFLPGERASFTANDLVRHCDVEWGTIAAVLRSVGITFDDSRDPVDDVMAMLRGANDLERTCLLRDDNDCYLMTARQIGSDSLRYIVENALKADERSWRKYDRVRKEVSEAIAVRALETALQTPPFATNLKYLAPKAGVDATALDSTCPDRNAVGDLSEADGLFLIDDVAICLEVKARAVADAAQRGDHVRLQREIDDILGSGVGQARRLESLITANGGLWLESGEWLELDQIRETRSVVTTLDDLGPLSVSLGDLQQAGLHGEGSLPWITSLHDLEVISKVLDRPAEFLLYVRRRTDSGVATHFRGTDELDMFMLFVEGSLYVEPDPDEIRVAHPTAPPASRRERKAHADDSRATRVGTFTDPLDAWMYWQEGLSDLEAPKPRFNTHPDAAVIVDFLADGRKPGWFRSGADLLSVAGTAQKRLGNALREIARRTRSDGRPHSVCQGYAGMWGYPTFFAATVPSDGDREEERSKLLTYMNIKRNQLTSDRSLGLLLSDQCEIVGVAYMNSAPAVGTEWEVIGAAIGLAPVGLASRPIPPSATRATRRLRGQTQKRRR